MATNVGFMLTKMSTNVDDHVNFERIKPLVSIIKSSVRMLTSNKMPTIVDYKDSFSTFFFSIV